MSLKAFHIIFITASSALSFGCGVWSLKNFWSAGGGSLDLLFGIGSFAAGVGLVLYGRYFLKKMKDIGFL